jgi:hypothetical protein
MRRFISTIRLILPSRHKRALSRIKGCPDHQRPDDLAGFFYQECLERSAAFVQEHLRRGKDSPFHGLENGPFFHELMAISFWTLEKLLKGDHAPLTQRIYHRYHEEFRTTRNSDHAPPEWVRERFTAYTGNWNDETGHHDAFGRKAAEFIFAERRVYSVPETAFWIIEFADGTLAEFRHLRRLCRALDLTLP